MSELSPALATALAGDRPLVFGAVRLSLPGGVVRLLDGAGVLTIGGETYTGRDAQWGVLDTIKGLGDSTADSAPLVSLGLIPSTTLALSTMLDPAMQGSSVLIMIGVANPATGAVIDTYTLFSGQLDVPTVTWGANDRRVEFKCSSIAERLFAVEEGRRLSDAFHQSVWPGELGLAFVTGVENNVPWGQQLNTSADQNRTDQGGQYGSTADSLGGFGRYSGGAFY
jgi:hypothetical protein